MMTFTYANSNRQDQMEIAFLEINMFRTYGSKHKTFQEGIIPILHNILEMEEERTLPNSFYKASIILFQTR